MAKVIMVQGTMSNAGKSLLVAGLCRVFHQDGYRVAPFKSQNMALNSYISAEGLEMGRAQVMQAEAAGIEPSIYMNPILLKPTNDCGSQVIVNGRSIGNMPAREYFAYKKKLIPEIKSAFHKLEEMADIIVIEGAGSPAEINLKENDIVNMGMAAMVDAPVLLVGDIDRGGVFAQLLGTLMLLEEEEKDRVKGLVINKFRGDKTILDPGIAMLEEKGGIPVTGVLPYVRLDIDDEDSLSERLQKKEEGLIHVAVIRLPRLSNFTDFSAFETIKGVSVQYVEKPQDLDKADLVIVPGSKNTIGDMKFLRESGLEAAILHYAEHGPVFGICGGYQMLGEWIEDPEGVEEGGNIRGMGLLPITTTLTGDKTLTRVKDHFGKMDGIFAGLEGIDIEGYEIHAGMSRFLQEIGTDPRSQARFASQIGTDPRSQAQFLQEIGTDPRSQAGPVPLVVQNGNVYGSYVHGIFDAGAALVIAKVLAEKKGISFDTTELDYFAYKESQYDALADMIRSHMDMEQVYGMLREAHIREE